MPVKGMRTVEYHKGGYTTSDKANPNWDEIQAFIRQLDKSRFPFVWLSQEDLVGGKLPEDVWPDFEVMGGLGDYWITCSVEGYQQRRCYFPEQGTAEIQVWMSDQGFSSPNCYVCHDLELVLHATSFFYEYGTFAPFIPWETR
jgi:hypothetical protein